MLVGLFAFAAAIPTTGLNFFHQRLIRSNKTTNESVWGYGPWGVFLPFECVQRTADATVSSDTQLALGIFLARRMAEALYTCMDIVLSQLQWDLTGSSPCLISHNISSPSFAHRLHARCAAERTHTTTGGGGTSRSGCAARGIRGMGEEWRTPLSVLSSFVAPSNVVSM